MMAVLSTTSLVSIDAVVLAPALLPTLGVVLVLVGDALLPKRRDWQVGLGLAMLLVGVVAALVAAVRAADEPVRTLCLPAPEGACLYTASPMTGTLQAAIFVILTMIYIGGAVASEHDDEHGHAAAAHH